MLPFVDSSSPNAGVGDCCGRRPQCAPRSLAAGSTTMRGFPGSARPSRPSFAAANAFATASALRGRSHPSRRLHLSCALSRRTSNGVDGGRRAPPLPRADAAHRQTRPNRMALIRASSVHDRHRPQPVLRLPHLRRRIYGLQRVRAARQAVGAGFLGERLNWRELCILSRASASFVAQPPLISLPRTAARSRA